VLRVRRVANAWVDLGAVIKDAPRVGEGLESQGDGGNKVVISCVLAQQIGVAVKDVEPSIEKRAETRCRSIRVQRARVPDFKSFQETHSTRDFVKASQCIAPIEVMKN